VILFFFLLQGWLTNSGDVNLERVQLIMNELGKAEDEIFKTRQQKELQFKAREKAKRRRTDGYNQHKPNWDLVKNTQFAPTVRFEFKKKSFVINCFC
jgi:5'-3' exonuclease